MDVLLDTPAASAWLARHGVRRTDATLRKLRCVGGSPRYRVLNGKPYYTEADLVAWIQERLSPPRSSSSEAAAMVPPSDEDPQPPRRISRRSAKPSPSRAAEAAPAR